MAPRDPDLLFNLGYAQKQLVDKIDPGFSFARILFLWQGIIPLTWLQIGTIMMSGLFFVFAGFRQAKKKKVFSGAGVCLFLILIFLVSGVNLAYYQEKLIIHAVILGESVSIRSGTSSTATRLFELHAGAKVRVKAENNGYLKIMLDKERVGWVSKKEAQTI